MAQLDVRLYVDDRGVLGEAPGLLAHVEDGDVDGGLIEGHAGAPCERLIGILASFPLKRRK